MTNWDLCQLYKGGSPSKNQHNPSHQKSKQENLQKTHMSISKDINFKKAWQNPILVHD